MSSFIDLMAGDRWSEADIVNRTEAVIAKDFPPARAEILSRKVMGQMLGQYALTADEQVEVGQYAMVSAQAGALADAARADMALLAQALDVEAGTLDPAAVAQAVTDLVAARAAARVAAQPAPAPTQEPQP